MKYFIFFVKWYILLTQNYSVIHDGYKTVLNTCTKYIQIFKFARLEILYFTQSWLSGSEDCLVWVKMSALWLIFCNCLLCNHTNFLIIFWSQIIVSPMKSVIAI